jgi:hypothetical protein
MTLKKSLKSLPRVMSWAIRRTLLIFTRNDAAALLTISSDRTNSGNDWSCLLKKKKVKLEMVLELKQQGAANEKCRWH